MTTRRIWGAVTLGLALSLLSPPEAQAQTGEERAAPEVQARESGEPVALAEIEVRGAVRREELQSTSATVLENKDIVDRIYRQPLDIVLRSPGASITQYGENGIAPAMRIRTFSGSHGGELAMYLDGIPLQDGGHADGYVDSNLIIPLEIESVEIIKGPASVYYGSRAAGGAMAFQSYKTGDFTKLNLRYGSYNEVDASAILAHTGESDLSQVYAFQVYHTDGWRENSDWDRGNVSGRWTYRFTDQFSVSLNLRAYKSEWNSAGYLPARLNLPKTAWVDDGSGEGNGGERSRFDGRLWANYLLNDESQFTFYAFGTDLDNTRWQTSYPGDAWRIGRPAPGNFSGGTEQTNTRKAYGGGLAYNYKGEWADKAANLMIGLEYLNENEKRDQYRLPWGTGRTRGTHYTETDYILKTTSLFAESSYQILEPLQVRLGGRYDRLTGELDTGPNQTGALGANRHYDANTRGFFSPKAGLLLTPLDWLDVYTNFGRGYGLPGLNNGDFFAQERFELTVRDQVELGYRLRPTDWLDLEMIYFHIWTDKDQTYDPLALLGQEMQNAGSTRRKGLETLVSLHPFDFWTLSANHTWQIAEYKKNANSQFLLDGYKMTGVPDSITNLELAYAPDYGLGGRLNFRYEAGELLRNNPAVTRLGAANTDPYRYYEAPDKTSLDLQLSYKFDDSYKLTVDVMNVLNRENYGSVGAPSVSNLGITDYTYSIQPPLTVYVSLGINWN